MYMYLNKHLFVNLDVSHLYVYMWNKCLIVKNIIGSNLSCLTDQKIFSFEGGALSLEHMQMHSGKLTWKRKIHHKFSNNGEILAARLGYQRIFIGNYMYIGKKGDLFGNSTSVHELMVAVAAPSAAPTNHVWYIREWLVAIKYYLINPPFQILGTNKKPPT